MKCKISIWAVAVIFLTIALTGCSKNPKVTGTAYVVTQDGTVVKMADVEVHAIDENALRAYLAKIKATESPEYSKTASTDDKAEAIRESFGNIAGFHMTSTDADGKYSFQELPPGYYLIYGSGSRTVGDTTEMYLWTRPDQDFEMGYEYTGDLNNDCDIITLSGLRSQLDVLTPQNVYNMAFMVLMEKYGW